MNQSLFHQPKLVIHGAGGHGLVVAEAADAAGFDVLGFLDDQPVAHTDSPWSVLSPSVLNDPQINLIVAIGDNATRQRIQQHYQQSGRTLVSVVHPSAVISPTATLGDGVYVGPLAIVNAQARIGDGVILNSACVVEHHNQIGAFAHLAPHAALAGRVSVGQLTLVGIGACVRPKITIGSHCLIAAGSVVVHDIADHTTVMGVPAQVRMNK